MTSKKIFTLIICLLLGLITVFAYYEHQLGENENPLESVLEEIKK